MDYFAAHNLRRWTHRVYMAYHFPLYILLRMGLISDGAFRKPWPAHLAWYLRGYTVEQADLIWNWISDVKVKNTWRMDTCGLLRQHKEDGYLTILVSGTPAPLLERLAKEIGADHGIGTEFEIRGGRFTGKSSGPACIADNKVTLTAAYLNRNQINIDYQASYAYADSISDRFMLELVANPVATYPDEALMKLAMERNWRIFPGEN